jgi:serine/threonine protein kinase
LIEASVRPANILLSTKGIPVLVDFGFAERYDPKSKRAFLSNLAYGTPEVSQTAQGEDVMRPPSKF